ncbi:TPA: hypothetical protein ACMDNI_003551, partial [Vibrio cholerae]
CFRGKMKKYYVSGLLTLAVVALPLIGWTFNFYQADISNDSSKWSDFGSFIGGTISPILAFVSFVGILATIKLQKDKNDYEKELIESQTYCENAISCLERAFAFISKDGTLDVPIRDRLAWLTSARLILQAEKLSQLISPKATSSKAMFESEKDYWRHRFYELLDYTGMQSFSMSEEFFSKASNIPGDEIEERSIKVIYKFALEFDSDNDPIDNVAKFTREELSEFHVSQIGLKKFLDKKITRRENAHNKLFKSDS